MQYYPPQHTKYFLGRINREESEQILQRRGCKDGLFLLREKLEEPGSYVLSLCYNKQIEHYKFKRNKNKTLQFVGSSRQFIGPIELVEFLKENDVGMVCRPSRECNRVDDTEPVYYLFVSNRCFNEAVTNQITLNCKTNELDDANGRFRYIYEKQAIKDIHFQVPEPGLFLKNWSKEHAEVLLKNQRLDNGIFLLRCNRFMKYKLSLCFENSIYHYRINFKDNKYSIKGSHAGEDFEFLIQLIDFYGRREGFLKCKLTMPLKENYNCDTNSNYRAFLYDDETMAKPAEVRNEEEFINDLILKLPKSIHSLGKFREGHFSKMFKASYRPIGSQFYMTVALKILKEKNDELIDEANKTDMLKHENIVKIIKCPDMNISLQANVIVLEYAELGSMKEYLKNNENIESKKLINYAEQVALALQHIAERKCVHRDVAARNVLVFTHDLVKLSDFGLAKHLSRNSDYYKYYISNTNAQMPIKWYPPEVLKLKKFSEKSGKL